MNKRRFEQLFQNMERLSIGVLGDFCLDVYWEADMTKSQLSRETSYYTLPVVRERINLGGAGNVIANIAALFPVKLCAFGVTGHDWRKHEMIKLLRKINVDAEGMVSDSERYTNAFVKPMRRGLSGDLFEDARLDFEPQETLSKKTERELLYQLTEKMPALDVLCVCDQLTFGCVTDNVRGFLSSGEHKTRIIADSRERIGKYRNVIIKPNDIEACRAMRQPLGADAEQLKSIAIAMEKRTERPVIMTMGDKGCIVAAGGEAEHVPAFPMPPPIDICGAGDTFLAVTACALAAGADYHEAVWLANAGASITIRQLHTTGTATRDELKALCGE